MNILVFPPSLVRTLFNPVNHVHLQPDECMRVKQLILSTRSYPEGSREISMTFDSTSDTSCALRIHYFTWRIVS